MLGTLRKFKTAIRSRAAAPVRNALLSPLVYPKLRHRALRDDPVTVLVYHTLGSDLERMDSWTVLPVGEFRKQIAFLKTHYDIISLDDAFDGTRDANRRPRVVITFDDGDVGLRTHLLGIVEEHRLPVTIYVATQHIVDATPFWFDRIINALQCSNPITIALSETGRGPWTVGRKQGPDNWATISDLLETLKMATPAHRAELCERVLEQAAQSRPIEFTRLAPLGVEQVKELASSPWVTIAAHSHCHNLLDQIPLAQATESVERSRLILEGWVSRPVRHFAYPNGNHTRALEVAIEGLGFRSAAALGMTFWDGETNSFRLPRIAIGRYDDLDRFKLRLTGI